MLTVQFSACNVVIINQVRKRSNVSGELQDYKYCNISIIQLDIRELKNQLTNSTKMDRIEGFDRSAEVEEEEDDNVLDFTLQTENPIGNVRLKEGFEVQ